MDIRIAISVVIVLAALLIIRTAFVTKEYTVKENDAKVVKTMTTKTRLFVVAGSAFWAFYFLRIVW